MAIFVAVFVAEGAAFSQSAANPKPTPSGSPKVESSTSKPTIVLPPEKAQPVRLPRFDKAPVIDGKLDEEIWRQAALLKDFYQVQPGDNVAPSKPTEVMLGYDSKFLYVAPHCYDEPEPNSGMARRTNGNRPGGIVLSSKHQSPSRLRVRHQPKGPFKSRHASLNIA